MSTERSVRTHEAGFDFGRHSWKPGIAVTAIGVVIVNIAPFLDWVEVGDDGPKRTGFETDSLIPFMAYLGVGILLALLYAASSAYTAGDVRDAKDARGVRPAGTTATHHGWYRSLPVVGMAIGLAVFLQCLVFVFEPMGGLERGDELNVLIGAFVGMAGAAIWSIGCGLLARANDPTAGPDRIT